MKRKVSLDTEEFKDGKCTNKIMNPLAALYLKQTTQFLKGENAYILGTSGFIQSLKRTEYSKDSYYLKTSAPWWKKPFYSFLVDKRYIYLYKKGEACNRPWVKPGLIFLV